MTLFGVIWMLIAFFLFFRDIKKLLVLTILGMVIQCSNVFLVGNQGIGPQVVTSTLFIIRTVVSKDGLKIKLTKRNALIKFSIVGLFVAVVLSTVANGLLSNKALSVLQLLIYVECFFCIAKVSELLTDEYVYKTVKRLTVFVIVLGIVQILITSNILPRLWLFSQIFFNEKRGDVYYYYNNYRRVTSTFMEPSYFSGFIVGAFYYFLDNIKKDKYNYIIVAISLAEIVFTFSSTAYVATFLVGILYILHSDKSVKTKTIYILMATFTLLIFFFGFYSVLDSVIISKGNTGSFITRTNLNARALHIFEQSPLLGTGYKTARASSIIYSIMAELGIVGLSFYLLLFLAMMKVIINKNKMTNRAVWGVLAVLIAQIISCPDLDLCTCWMWLYIFAMSDRNTKIAEANARLTNNCART